MTLLARALMLLCPATTLAASFPCERATGAVEQTICATPALGALDRQLAERYRALRQNGDTSALVPDQRRWLAERNRCGDAACLRQAYVSRIAQLDSWTTPVAPTNALFGDYAMPRTIMALDSDAEDWSTQAVDDCLSLHGADDGSVSFTFQLTQTNFHQCSMSGRLRVAGDHLAYLADAESAGEPPCALRITATGGEIVLHDPDGACQRYWCGARAAIDGARFARAVQSPTRCPGD